MEAAEDDAVPLVVEECDREALVGSGVLERVEADEPDVLEAAQRSALDDGVHRFHLVHPLGRAHSLLGAANQAVVEGAAVLATHQLAVVANCASQPGALDGETDDEQEQDGGEHAEDERQVIEEKGIEIDHWIGGIIAAPWPATEPRPAVRSRMETEVPMARRAGKAANRKARQRSAAQRAATRPAAPLPAPAATPVPPVGTPDAREAVSLDPPKRVSPTRLATAGSTLTTAERAEYHYVERDLRNIGILTAVMAVLLFVAWIAFSALGLVG